ncbi:MAG TPA: aspartate kinase [Flavobacteriaceae bacterium]|nr:aspartate kinase [Flavobacteriaceae bacterium]
MQVFKFGGASVKDAKGVKNLYRILQLYPNTRKVVVVSAMNKMTNLLEEVVGAYFNNPEDLSIKIDGVKEYHLQICAALFDSKHKIHRQINTFTEKIESFLKVNKSENYDFVYDQIVPYGELMSTTIVSEYLRFKKLENTLLDARELIKTDSIYREAKIDWETTENNLKERIQSDKLSLIQGFIASDQWQNTTTLGREGSDYTAGIIAYCLDAEEVLIWKNVDGVLNADPQEFKNTVLLNQISYQEAIELSFYGASVIHPKTIQPLQRKEIPLYVKSFYNPEKKGTSVCERQKIDPLVPCFIVKKELILLSISTMDFSFFVEENISEVFALFHKYQVKVHLIQNSAISFSLCINNKFRKADILIDHLQKKFKVSYNKDVMLYTIRHFDQEAIERIRKNRDVLLEQRTRETVQFVTK